MAKTREKAMNHPGLHITLLVSLLGLGLAGHGAHAAVPAPSERDIVEPIVARPASTAEAGFSEAELDQLLAPIALYPDALLSQVLIAATYPLEIVSAARWSRDNPDLDGENAVAAVADRDWDPSVKALVAFPDLLARLDQDLEWTRNLGDAVLLQEQDVMDSIQFLRARAGRAGRKNHHHRADRHAGRPRALLRPALGLRELVAACLSARRLGAASALLLRPPGFLLEFGHTHLFGLLFQQLLLAAAQRRDRTHAPLLLSVAVQACQALLHARKTVGP